MASTVEGTLRDGTVLPDIFDALFPCGSVTGAPKIRTMEIIRELEGVPRGIYTGAIGLLAPDGTCTCSVAIRTIVIDRDTGVATLNVGAGITADSVPEDEYAECVLKGAFATPATGDRSPFHLLETLRLQDGVLVRLERHLRRMRDSARYFGYTWNDARVRERLQTEALAHATGTWRVRLIVDRDGEPAVTVSAHEDIAGTRWRVAFANAPVDPADPFLFNKTTRRTTYEAARRARPDVDDVLLWNPTRELTESTIANVVIDIDGERCTPPVTCGLLGGVMRSELLDRGEIRERVITRGEVMRAERLWLVNSLRGWIEAEVVR
jgi:para-aminobenzoate synthetase/4-amino-4-deoxychorismate lyase